MRTVSDMREAVRASRGANELVMLSMRVMIATGVSLKDPNPAHDRDPVRVEKVRTALADLGVRV